MAKRCKKPTLETLTDDVEAVRKLAHETANNVLSVGCKLNFAITLLEKIMSAQEQAAKQLNDVTAELTETKTQVAKVGTETTSLIEKIGTQSTKIDELLALVAAGGNVTPELQAAIDGAVKASADVKAQVKVVDDLVEDIAPTP